MASEKDPTDVDERIKLAVSLFRDTLRLEREFNISANKLHNLVGSFNDEELKVYMKETSSES